MHTILSPQEIDQMEQALGARGVTAAEVLSIFRARGMRMSEGTFRKYVQAGLLPRSRRVGTKGKHRGSRGIYPVGVIRRLNTIRGMMAEGMTLEEIRGSFLFLRGELDVVEAGLADVVGRLERALEETPLPQDARTRLEEEIERVHTSSARLVARIEKLAGRIVAARIADENVAQDSEREGTR